MSVADLNTAVEAAITAMEAGDWTTAVQKLMAAKTRLIALPDAQQNSALMRWDRNAIDGLIDQCRKEKQTAARGTLGIQTTKVTYVEPT